MRIGREHQRPINRRAFLQSIARAATSISVTASSFGLGEAATHDDRGSTMKSTLDDALVILRDTGTETHTGAPNHGPMAAEALDAMGRAEAITGWAERYRRQLDALPEATSPIVRNGWQSVLGAIDRSADWVAFFRRQLAEAPWRMVLADWIGRLMPGVPSAGAHGLIRTAHALRALQHAETPLRVEELGSALAYWAAYYRQLPGTPNLVGDLRYDEAVEQMPLFLSGEARRGPPREVYVRVMSAHAMEFAAAVDRAGPPESIGAALSTVSEAGARVYLNNASRQPLVLLHTVTVPAALRMMLPQLPEDLQATAFAYVWQNVAGVIAAYADEPPKRRDDWPVPDTATLIERAIETDDPHAIKLTEACLRENRLNPQSAYLAAAADWIDRLHRARDWSYEEREEAGMEFRSLSP